MNMTTDLIVTDRVDRCGDPIPIKIWVGENWVERPISVIISRKIYHASWTDQTRRDKSGKRYDIVNKQVSASVNELMDWLENNLGPEGNRWHFILQTIPALATEESIILSTPTYNILLHVCFERKEDYLLYKLQMP